MEENLLLALVLWIFTPDVSELATLVAMLATGGMGSGGNGQWLVNLGDWLANGLGIAKCISIGQVNVRWQWFAYSGWTKCDCTGHVAIDAYIGAQVSDVATEG